MRLALTLARMDDEVSGCSILTDKLRIYRTKGSESVPFNRSREPVPFRDPVRLSLTLARMGDEVSGCSSVLIGELRLFRTS
jgi:hypothetical protein